MELGLDNYTCSFTCIDTSCCVFSRDWLGIRLARDRENGSSRKRPNKSVFRVRCLSPVLTRSFVGQELSRRHREDKELQLCGGLAISVFFYLLRTCFTCVY